MTSPLEAEKRKYARLDIALTVAYRVVEEGGKISESAEALSSDISAGGLRLMTPSALAPGAKMQMEIYIGDEDEAIHIDGEVVWQQPIAQNSFETGVVLLHMEDHDKARFLSLIVDQMSALVGYQNGGRGH